MKFMKLLIKKIYLFSAVSIGFILVGNLASAARYNSPGIGEMFNLLSDSGVDYVTEGTICEQVARVRLSQQYPAPQFEVHSSISYADHHKVIGELDVVVFEQSTGRAILVAEVKCCRDFGQARRKAADQRNRFIATMRSGVPIDFFSIPNPNERYSYEQFRIAPQFISVSQRGGERAGFDMSLDYTLEEMKQLRDLLIRCQNQGRCRRP